MLTYKFQFCTRASGHVNRAGAGSEKHPERESPIHVDEAFISIPETTWQLCQ
jgi:hypothetical protein